MPVFSMNSANVTVERAQRVVQALEALHQGLTLHLKRSSASVSDSAQAVTHGYAWLSAYVETLKCGLKKFKDLLAQEKAGQLETALFQIGFAEYLRHVVYGVPMNQTEFVRPHDFPDSQDLFAGLVANETVLYFLKYGGNPGLRGFAAELITQNQGVPAFGLQETDEMTGVLRDQFARFARDKVAPYAHEWHSKDDLIPLELIKEMADLGVFGLTIPEAFGGSGMGKTAMCVMSEELSAGYIGVGSLGTRTEIAAELIMAGGTEAQKQKYLPKLASGEILPTAVFTEPNSGSELGGLKTRAVRDGGVYRITGSKTWITHAARADLMTLLVRTDPNSTDWRGLSMFLAEKPRGDDANPFPADGVQGGEIAVLGYRGMKEYEMNFDNFIVPAENLLGGEEGNGFKQLMKTFESARVQTAARALGVAQNALSLGVKYATERVQFGKPIIKFGRVADKIALTAAEIFFVRALTEHAAESIDSGKRCDIEAGMAKLLAARVAWSGADNVLQIHGGNGFALEYEISRVLCDARILNIFEGAAEIQAEVIAKRLLAQAEDKVKAA